VAERVAAAGAVDHKQVTLNRLAQPGVEVNVPGDPDNSYGQQTIAAVRAQPARVFWVQGHNPDREEADTLKTRMGKIAITTAIGAGALGVGLGGSLAVASAATAHTSSVTSSTSPSSGAATTAVNAGSAPAAATPSPSASSKPAHNCQNMKGGNKGMHGAPARNSTAT
jgi:hypothetical protein